MLTFCSNAGRRHRQFRSSKCITRCTKKRRKLSRTMPAWEDFIFALNSFNHCREETQAVQEEQMYYKMHQKQKEAQQDNAWMYSVPEWHNAELAGQNKPWTVPSQLLTAEEEVCHQLFYHVSVIARKQALDCSLPAAYSRRRGMS